MAVVGAAETFGRCSMDMITHGITAWLILTLFTQIYSIKCSVGATTQTYVGRFHFYWKALCYYVCKWNSESVSVIICQVRMTTLIFLVFLSVLGIMPTCRPTYSFLLYLLNTIDGTVAGHRSGT